MGLFSKLKQAVTVTYERPVETRVTVEDYKGAGQYRIETDGHISVNYLLRNPESPNARRSLAALENQLFVACANEPFLQHKPLENIRKRFRQFNAEPTMDGVPPGR